MLSLVHTSAWPDTWREYVTAVPASRDHALDRVDLALAQSECPLSALRILFRELKDIATSLHENLPRPDIAPSLLALAERAEEVSSTVDDVDAAIMLQNAARFLAHPHLPGPTS